MGKNGDYRFLASIVEQDDNYLKNYQSIEYMVRNAFFTGYDKRRALRLKAISEKLNFNADICAVEHRTKLWAAIRNTETDEIFLVRSYDARDFKEEKPLTTKEKRRWKYFKFAAMI